MSDTEKQSEDIPVQTKPKRSWKRICCYVAIGIFILLVGAVIGFIIWAVTGVYQPTSSALEYCSFRPGSGVSVSTANSWYSFNSPSTNSTAKVGLVFYPGAKVDIRAYCPVLFKIANSSSNTPITAVVVPMPLHLAFFGSEKAKDVMGAYPDINKWIIGGHSLGGAFAADFAANNLNGKIKGLFTLAAGPTKSMKGVKETELAITSISASLDGLWNAQKQSQAEIDNWPSHAFHVKIEGGNHAQFGDYGKQQGDNDAVISVEAQTQIVVDNVLRLSRL